MARGKIFPGSMKKMILVLSLISSSAFAVPVQFIDCSPKRQPTRDRVIVSIRPDQTGTLFLTSGIENDGSSENSGVLPSTRVVTATPAVARFEAANRVSYFAFELPAEWVFRRDYGLFDASITLGNLDRTGTPIVDALTCFTRIYENP